MESAGIPAEAFAEREVKKKDSTKSRNTEKEGRNL
jgi:hypothetical protein